jgi:hypothetical protein
VAEFSFKQENLEKAARAVERARVYFRELGFCTSDAEHPAKNGADLEVWRPDPAGDHLPPIFSATVEVKAVGFSRGSWRSRGRHLRTGDDFIAYVWPNGRVHVEDFEDHELLRCKDGGRHLGKLGKLYACGAAAMEGA